MDWMHLKDRKGWKVNEQERMLLEKVRGLGRGQILWVLVGSRQSLHFFSGMRSHWSVLSREGTLSDLCPLAASRHLINVAKVGCLYTFSSKTKIEPNSRQLLPCVSWGLPPSK